MTTFHEHSDQQWLKNQCSVFSANTQLDQRALNWGKQIYSTQAHYLVTLYGGKEGPTAEMAEHRAALAQSELKLKRTLTFLNDPLRKAFLYCQNLDGLPWAFDLQLH